MLYKMLSKNVGLKPFQILLEHCIYNWTHCLIFFLYLSTVEELDKMNNSFSFILAFQRKVLFSLAKIITLLKKQSKKENPHSFVERCLTDDKFVGLSKKVGKDRAEYRKLSLPISLRGIVHYVNTINVSLKVYLILLIK